MKHLLIFIILIFPVNSFASTHSTVNESYIEFAKVMGIYQLVDESVKQTEFSMRKQMKEVIGQLHQILPDLTDDHVVSINNIVDTYITSITSAIDIDSTVNVYITELVEGMSTEEVKFAKSFYQSERGRKVQNTIAIASKKFNQHYLSQVENATRKNHPILMDELEKIMKDAYEK